LKMLSVFVIISFICGISYYIFNTIYLYILVDLWIVVVYILIFADCW